MSNISSNKQLHRHPQNNCLIKQDIISRTIQVEIYIIGANLVIEVKAMVCDVSIPFWLQFTSQLFHLQGHTLSIV